MTEKEALKVLENHQKWRLGDDSIKETDPKELTKAIDIVILILYEIFKKTND